MLLDMDLLPDRHDDYHTLLRCVICFIMWLFPLFPQSNTLVDIAVGSTSIWWVSRACLEVKRIRASCSMFKILELLSNVDDKSNLAIVVCGSYISSPFDLQLVNFHGRKWPDEGNWGKTNERKSNDIYIYAQFCHIFGALMWHLCFCIMCLSACVYHCCCWEQWFTLSN